MNTKKERKRKFSNDLSDEELVKNKPINFAQNDDVVETPERAFITKDESDPPTNEKFAVEGLPSFEENGRLTLVPEVSFENKSPYGNNYSSEGITILKSKEFNSRPEIGKKLDFMIFFLLNCSF